MNVTASSNQPGTAQPGRRVNGFARAVALALLFSTGRAHTEPNEPRGEAAERFDRAIRLVNAGDLSGSLGEFQRAAAIAPSTIVFFDLGLVYAALHRPVDSARALERALAHPNELTPENLEKARQVLREQRELIGLVELTSNVSVGSVEVDNVEVAKLPLVRPLEVASGPRVIGIVSPGHAPARRELVIAGKTKAHLELSLVPIEGLLAHIALGCPVPAADVFVDGERVGKTPLDATVTVTPGAHTVEVRRPGYLSSTRTVSLQEGATASLVLTPRIDVASLAREGGYLSVHASETQAVLSVDGEEARVLSGPVRLPRGPHRLRLERGGFLPTERDADVQLATTTTVSVVFEPTPDTRAAYVTGAETQRFWSWFTLGAGAALAAGGMTLALVEQHALPDARQDLAAVRAGWEWQGGGSCDHAGDLDPEKKQACVAQLADAEARVSSLVAGRNAGWVVAGVGGATLVTGVILLVTGDDPHRYDRPPSRLAWSVAPSVSGRGWTLSARGAF